MLRGWIMVTLLLGMEAERHERAGSGSGSGSGSTLLDEQLPRWAQRLQDPSVSTANLIEACSVRLHQHGTLGGRPLHRARLHSAV